MDVEVPELLGGGSAKVGSEEDRLRVKRKTLEAVLHQCQRALELLSSTGFEDDDGGGSGGSAAIASGAVPEDGQEAGEGSSSPCSDKETEELCDLLKSRLECPDFLRKLESAQSLVPQNIAEEGSSWDLINDSDIWEDECTNLDQGDYVLVKQEDIVDGIACFMAAYLLSLKQTKDLTPNQLQEALSKTFSVKKKKGKLRKAWDGTKVIYNVASWGATAIGIYQIRCFLGLPHQPFGLRVMLSRSYFNLLHGGNFRCLGLFGVCATARATESAWSSVYSVT